MDQTLTILDIAARLAVAAVLGGAIGLDRNLHAKSTGIRTHGLVAVGAAFVVISVATIDGTFDQDAAARVAQGILAGIGFLGAGVIIRHTEGGKVHGLTTAASIWATAAIGVGCAVGLIAATTMATAIMLAVVVFGGRIERALRRFLARHGLDEPKSGDGAEPGGDHADGTSDPLAAHPDLYTPTRRAPTDTTERNG